MRKVADYKKIGKRLQEARIKANKTQGEFAAICDCDPKHMSAMETGTRKVPLDVMLLASREFNVSLEYFTQDIPHENNNYYVAEEFSTRLKRMNHQTRMSLLGIMDNLLELQTGLSMNNEKSK